MAPSVFRSSETVPFLPSAATRTASSAASSTAAPMPLRISASNCAMSDTAFLRRMANGKLSVGFPLFAVRHFAVRSRSGERRLGLPDDRLERDRLADGEVGEDLAIDRHAGLAETVDETAVGQAERAHRRIEPLNPQGAERTLLPLAVAVGILRGL